MWFNKNDIILKNKILIEDLHGYVLPHSSTKHTGKRFYLRETFNKLTNKAGIENKSNNYEVYSSKVKHMKL